MWQATYAVSHEDWAQTPASVRRMTDALWEEVQRLREQAGQTSRNSSRPPSTDPPVRPRQGKDKTKDDGTEGRRTTGHASTAQPLLPSRGGRCGGAGETGSLWPLRHRVPAEAADPGPLRHQVYEIPPLTRTVTEYQLHTLTCPHCGQATAAALPAGVPYRRLWAAGDGARGHPDRAVSSVQTGRRRAACWMWLASRSARPASARWNRP